MLTTISFELLPTIYSFIGRPLKTSVNHYSINTVKYKLSTNMRALFQLKPSCSSLKVAWIIVKLDGSMQGEATVGSCIVCEQFLIQIWRKEQCFVHYKVESLFIMF